ncbi:hypothetical protein AV654_19375 [Paenibacillus elgii]|uniref:ATP-dependent helicase n=1 Tax=Paenibacillus elgii TaxID=189691 RepID=A0A163XMR3_9BACL|nr:ATP-dependent DNA helicase [Paenibacillus elgii]KZE78138.1 hypothetical protein AV654_19375 [Paenibacillus elgii]
MQEVGEGESKEQQQIDLYFEQLDRIFKADGILSNFFPEYKPREPQIEMARAVGESLVYGKHGLAEAGTGTGKSLGYSIPAALYCKVFGKRLVLSTFTITLQNQLIGKDLPLVRSVLAELGYSLSFELAKGRSHYICKRRLHELYEDALINGYEHMEQLKEIVSKVDELWVGDRSEIPFQIHSELWKEIQGKSDDCLSENSPFHGSCFIQAARASLKSADIIVTNHAMFFTDYNLKVKGMYGMFPDYDAVIFDEGHRIEDVFSKYFQKRASVRELESLFDRVLQKRSQWAKEILDEDMEQQITEIRNKLIRRAYTVFSQLTERMLELKIQHGLLGEPLVQKSPFDVGLNEFGQYFIDLKESKKWDKPIERGLENMIETIERIRKDFNHLLFNEDRDRWANWLEIRKAKPSDDLNEEAIQAYRLVLTGAPIEASTVLRETLFKGKTVIVTSATLTTSGNFEFVSGRLGMDDYTGYQVGSPFNYAKQSMLIVPGNAPIPKNFDAYLEFCIDAIKRIELYTQGRTFILFTSFFEMKQMYDALKPWFEEKGLTPILHTGQADREQLLREFKEGEKTVLFGAESFWEGVDVPGDDLICVIIPRLPFPVPSDPLVEARCSKLKEKGHDPFERFMIPSCILKLKQGVGRLIRTVDDYGAVVILDSRLIRYRFGEQILRSLPSARFSTRLQDITTIGVGH